ncbi:DUF1294 domain-containing protein [Enterococcus faecalis]
MLTESIVIYFILINLLVYCMMAYDKRQARKNRWRIPQRRLLCLGLLGGGLGGLIGGKQFHHKTQKMRFFCCYFAGAVMMVLVLIFLFYHYR